MTLLVTGAAGFIGAAVCSELLNRGHAVLGVDSLNDYYDPILKEARLNRLRSFRQFQFRKIDLADATATADLFSLEKFSVVAHLAAQAGVRYSLTHPHVYLRSNVDAFLNVLEGCRHAAVEHLVYASSSSVYGANTKMPFS